MTIGFGQIKLIQCLKAIMSITLLAGLAGTLILASEVEAQWPDEVDERLKALDNRLEKTESELNAIRDKLVPIGTILPFGGSVEKNKEGLEKKGWLFCDGAKVERSRYPELYKKIGTAFGKPDENTFNLPDLRGRFVRGVAHKDPTDPSVEKRDPDAYHRMPSATGGNDGKSKYKVGSVQEDAVGKHKHTIKSAHANEDRIIKGRSEDDPPAVAGYPHHPTDKPRTEESEGPETRPKNIYVNWIIYAGATK